MRKIWLNPLQRDILWLLEEAGEECFTTLAVSLTRNATTNDFQSAVTGLIQLGFCQRSVQNGANSLVLTASGRSALTR
jgi:hypothetical protein